MIKKKNTNCTFVHPHKVCMYTNRGNSQHWFDGRTWSISQLQQNMTGPPFGTQDWYYYRKWWWWWWRLVQELTGNRRPWGPEEANKVTPLAAATKSLIATDSGFTIASAPAKSCLIEPTNESFTLLGTERGWLVLDRQRSEDAPLRRTSRKNREGEDDDGCVRGASCGRASLLDCPSAAALLARPFARFRCIYLPLMEARI
jgi:hypothetical protein